MAQAPQVSFNIKDELGTNATPIVVYPLDKQVYCIKAQKGEAGLKYFSTFTEAQSYYGAETFNENNPTYFSNANMFAKNVLAYNGCWLYRLLPDDADTANAVIYATLQAGDIPQYTKAADGSRAVDVNGDWIPLMVEAVPVTAPGYTITWSVEPLTGVQTIDNLTVVTTPDPGNDPFVKYPIAAIQLKFPGVSGNNYGFEIFCDLARNSQDVLESTKNLMVTMRFKEKMYSASTVNFIRDDTGAVENSFTLLSDIIDSSTNINVGINDILVDRYTGTNTLPFVVHNYEANFITVSDLLLGVLTTTEEDSLGDLLTDGSANVINIFSGVNPFTGFEYDNILPVNTVALRNITNFFTGGSDGTLTMANEFTMVQNFLTLDSFPDVEDEARYPITAMVDPGYNLATKYAMIDFMDIRKDLVIVLSPYQMDHAELTQAEEFSVGQSLVTRALLTQESVEYGTEACRACVKLQSGVLNTSVKNRIVPATHWVATQMAKTYNKTYLSDPMLSFPYSINDQFKSLNWYPVKLDYKNKLYSNGMNYTQWLDVNTLHVPALQSVYTNDTSKLVDFPFVLVCMFIRQLTRYIGMKYTGTELPKNVRHFAIKNDVETSLNTMLNNQYFPTIAVDQTAAEAALGYVDHVYINLPADKSPTLIKVDLIAQKPA